MATQIIHFRDIRLRNNAGMSMPLCYASMDMPLDCDKGRLPTSGKIIEVTCKHCLRLFPKRYPWALGS